MAEGTVTTPEYVAKLIEQLQQRFPGGQVSYQQVRADRYRFVLVWNGFEGMGHPERQRLVWDVADVAVAKADVLKVAMIITLAPSELPEE